jgi:hypothetical protein
MQLPPYHLLRPLGAYDGNSAMRNPVDIDRGHSYAIVHEIGERLPGLLGDEAELPPNMRTQIDRLREEEQSPSIAPD